MIDIESVIGTHSWQEITINDSCFCVPDLNWCGRFLILCICIYFFVKGIFQIVSLFK